MISQISDHQIQSLKRKTNQPLTNSDCRVALRESDGDYDGAFKWLLQNKILQRPIPGPIAAPKAESNALEMLAGLM